MRKRRVLHLIDTGGPGGAETIFLALVRGLPGLGWESVPVVPEDDWLAGALRASGYEAPVLAANRSFDVGFALRLRRLIRGERIDLIQTHLLGSSVYAAIARMGMRTSVVSTFHGHPDIPTRGTLTRVKLGLLRGGANRLVCVSESLRSHFQQRGAFGRDVEVIPNGVDLAALAPGGDPSLREELGIPLEAPLMGAVGNIRRSKAYPVLIEAFARVRRSIPECHLVIAGQGGGALLEELRSMRARLGLDGTCHLAGFRQDVSRVLAALDLFALSSSDEGFSLATVQAMAAGLPVVATRCGGPEEIIGDSGAGRLVPVDDPDALAAEIVRVLTCPEQAAAMGAAARRRALATYGLDRMIEGYAGLYARCLSGR